MRGCSCKAWTEIGRQAVATARREAFEEAAKIAEQPTPDWNWMQARDTAAALRAKAKEEK